MNLTPDQPEETPNVVPLNDSIAKDLEIIMSGQKKQFSCPGLHRKVQVDMVNRIVQCTECGYVLDPFDYIADWAKKGEHRMRGLKEIEIKRKVAQAEYDDLMRKIKNLRIRLKRAGQPQPELERREYDSQRLNAWYTGSKP